MAGAHSKAGGVLPGGSRGSGLGQTSQLPSSSHTVGMGATSRGIPTLLTGIARDFVMESDNFILIIGFNLVAKTIHNVHY